MTGKTGGDDALLRTFGDEAVGLISASPYTLDLDNDANNRFVGEMLKNYNAVPGFYAAGLYVNCEAADAGLKAVNGDPGDRVKFMAALKTVNLTDTARGPIKFDHLGNVVGNIYIRRLGKEGAKYGLKLWNKTIKTLANSGLGPRRSISAQPVYSRNYPPLVKCHAA